VTPLSSSSLSADPVELEGTFTALLAALKGRDDPFTHPVLGAAMTIARAIASRRLDEATLGALVSHLRDGAFHDRAERLAAYVGGVARQDLETRLAALVDRLVRPDPADSPIPFAAFREKVEQIRFTAVFTAHPTFALPPEVAEALTALAVEGKGPSFASHRPARPPTLDEEFAAAQKAIRNGRLALDRLNRTLFETARRHWPERWRELIPVPIVLASWVGYDLDGRNDISWLASLRFRLRAKEAQLTHLATELSPLGESPLLRRIEAAREAVREQIAACPAEAEPDAVSRFARLLIASREQALLSPEPLLPLFEAALAQADDEAATRLLVARAGLTGHGLALARAHFRLNAAQVHNSVRLRLGLDDPPSDPARRRVLLSTLDEALAAVETEAVDFGMLLAERASAARLMMLIAQIVKHVDAASPIRFLIAETETGYTLLAALWLARLFGVADRIEICPLFETADGLERGVRVLTEALRSPHFRDYVSRQGRICLQFGYSDSGRFVGQLAASYFIERLKLKIAEQLHAWGLAGIEVVFFDTHGESIGRGGHPHSLSARFAYLSPPAMRQRLAALGLSHREESSFQGGDGYLLFGRPELALATLLGIAEQALFPPPAAPDPIYDEPDFAADFFATIRSRMAELIADPGYAALLGMLGPAFVERSGSRPTARVDELKGERPSLRHPREMRAIPNNALLHQLGWLANTLYGLGAAVVRHPETFQELRDSSPRFRRALDLAQAAAALSDIEVLRAVIGFFDPETWLDLAAHTEDEGRRGAFLEIARLLETAVDAMGLIRLFRRFQADHLAWRQVWSDAPEMRPRAALLHALRLALICEIWTLGTRIPEFAPRDGLSRDILLRRLFRLDIPGVLDDLAEIFPKDPDPTRGLDFGEPPGRLPQRAYAREHEEIFAPMGRLFALVREIGIALTHEVGAFG
jgi:phosphoenolpyruvate carboxylase